MPGFFMFRATADRRSNAMFATFFTLCANAIRHALACNGTYV